MVSIQAFTLAAPAVRLEVRADVRGDDLIVLADPVVLRGLETAGITVVAGSDALRRPVLVRAARRALPDRHPRMLFAGASATTDVAALLAPSARLADGGSREPADVAARLARLGHRMPVAVIVDEAALDLEACRAFLQELSHRIAPDAVFAVYAWRSGMSEHGETLSLAPPANRAKLRPLTAATVEQILRGALAGEVDDVVLAQLPLDIGGNARLVDAALDDLAAADSVHDWMTEAGPAFGRAAHHILAKHDLADAARAIAVLGDHYDPATLSQVLELSLPGLGAVFDDLIALALLAPDHTLRPWVQAAVAAGLEPEAMRPMHRRAAEVLHAEGAPMRVVAQHLVATGEAMQPWALDVLRDAAAQAIESRDFDEAAGFLNLALGWTAGRDERAELRARLLDLTWAAQPRRVGEMLALVSASALDGQLPAHRIARLAQLLAWQGRTPGARQLLDLATDRAGDDRAEVELAVSRLWVRHVFPEAPALPGSDLRPELIIGMYPWLPRAVALMRLLAAGDTEAATAEAVEVLHRVLPHESDLEVGQLALFTLLSLERTDEILAWTRRFAGQLSAGDPPQWHSLVAAAQAKVAFWAGDFDTAIGRARTAIDLVGDLEWGVLAAVPRAVLLMSLTETGRHDEVAAAFAAPLPQCLTRSPYGLLYLRARSQHHLATNARQSAADDFRAIGEILTAWKLEAPGLLPWRADLAEAALRLGDLDSARRLAREHLDAIPASGLWSRGRALRLLAQALPQPEGLPLLREAVTLLEKRGESLEHARALDAMARAYQEAGELATGRSVQRRAEKVSRSRTASRAPEPVNPTDPARKARRGPLSRAEAKVARLASQGYTNREISSMLYITMSTVEQHLTRIYRKLGIDRRDELDAIWGTGPGVA
ncbi:LuxR C-terminal-related transcriptional regulator [Actinoplanes sp. TFC3]|uniref:helix-turn-helix transcriptional regulator n=1 Tax=Actinoplanes sp. TFC3 TaxID=1710355 RepID=UPI00082E254F|nr:LuxR C-terminal-related transcriptional regulator [Actinoplanes sp. TFC3]